MDVIPPASDSPDKIDRILTWGQERQQPRSTSTAALPLRKRLWLPACKHMAIECLPLQHQLRPGPTSDQLTQQLMGLRCQPQAHFSIT